MHYNAQYKIKLKGVCFILTKNYTFKIHTNIMRALKAHNEISPGSSFTTLDMMILCLVKSFTDSKTDFFMSVKEIANITLSSESTVHRSLKRLCAAGLLERKKDKSNKYILIYKDEAVKKLLTLAD